MMKHPLSPRVRLGMLFVGVARRWRAVVDASLSHDGLSDATWAPLLHLARAGEPLSQKALAARIGLDGSSLVRLVDILVDKDLVVRCQDPADRRANRLSLTAEGQAKVARIQQSVDAVEGDLLAGFDDDEIMILVTLLDRLDRRILAYREPMEGDR
ncbi:MarR family winged helix-turn-helix transcriptional regulator [Rhodospirillum sp. A1_3_36]|uniref:MarR family winged helix-turn-helix transcriptional regulator n=1 Tax=Rhodospirillum sp. A1_3_36 TaxID=3391666 RepID=UPI0039A4B45F